MHNVHCTYIDVYVQVNIYISSHTYLTAQYIDVHMQVNIKVNCIQLLKIRYGVVCYSAL